MIAHDGQRVPHAREYPLPVMRDTRSLAVHQRARADNLAPVRFSDRLMTETHPKDRNAFAPLPNRCDADPSLSGGARAWRYHYAVDVHFSDVVDGDLVVPLYDRILSKLAEVLNEVVGEGVVIIDDEKHR